MFSRKTIVLAALGAALVAPNMVMADAVMRLNLPSKILFAGETPDVDPQLPDDQYTAQPGNIAVGAGLTKSTSFSYESGGAQRTFDVVAADVGGLAPPSWILASTGTVLAAPPAAVPAGQYGPYKVRMAGGLAEVLSQSFVVDVSPLPPIVFSAQPGNLSVFHGGVATTPYSFDASSLGSPEAALVLLADGSSAPGWLHLNQANVEVSPSVAVPVGNYGPFAIRVSDTGRADVHSNGFTVAVTAAPLAFTTQPASFSVITTTTKTIPIAVNNSGYSTQSYAVKTAANGPAPDWVSVNASGVTVNPIASVAIGTYGPYVVEVTDPARPSITSAQFSVQVTASSASLTKPNTGSISNYTVATNFGGSVYGNPNNENVAVRNQLYDGLDNPVVSFKWSGSIDLLGLTFPTTGVTANSCVIRIQGAALPNPLVLNVYGVTPAGASKFYPYISIPVVNGKAHYDGPCLTGGETYRWVYLSLPAGFNTLFTITEFKVGEGGIYP